MAARGNLEVLSNVGDASSAELNWDEAEEARYNGAARPKLVPTPILSHALSNTSGLLILNTDEVVRFQALRQGLPWLRACWGISRLRAQPGGFLGKPPGPETFLIRPSLYSS